MKNFKEGLKRIGGGISTIFKPVTNKIEVSRKTGSLYNIEQGFKQVKEGVKYIFGRTAAQILDRTIDELIVDISDPGRRTIYKTLLKNQHSYQNSFDSSTSSMVKGLSSYSLPLTRKILDKTTAMNFVGVQPMEGPVGLIYRLAFMPATSQMVDGEGRQMSLQVIKETATAGTRKLQTKYSPEGLQDAAALHEIDFMAEIVAALGSEIGDEINNEMIHRISSVATEQIASENLSVTINKAANNIATKTRRGPGNFAIVSVRALSQLIDEGFKMSGGKHANLIREVGILNGTIRVFVNALATDHVIVGYKGPGEMDTGITYCPYVMLMSSGVVVDPMTFQPMISMMTRYGIHQAENAADYYVKINIDGETE